MNPTFYSEIAHAIPVLVGGLLAVLGGVATQILTHWLARRRERESFRRERIESLVKALFAQSQWIQDHRDAMIHNKAHDTPQPLFEAQMIQNLYFPEFHADIGELMRIQLPMIKFIGEQRVARLRNENEWVKTFDSKPFLEAYERYVNKMLALTEKCRKLL